MGTRGAAIREGLACKQALARHLIEAPQGVAVEACGSHAGGGHHLLGLGEATQEQVPLVAQALQLLRELRPTLAPSQLRAKRTVSLHVEASATQVFKWCLSTLFDKDSGATLPATTHLVSRATLSKSPTHTWRAPSLEGCVRKICAMRSRNRAGLRSSWEMLGNSFFTCSRVDVVASVCSPRWMLAKLPCCCSDHSRPGNVPKQCDGLGNLFGGFGLPGRLSERLLWGHPEARTKHQGSSLASSSIFL